MLCVKIAHPKGWQQDTLPVNHFFELPSNSKLYLTFKSELIIIKLTTFNAPPMFDIKFHLILTTVGNMVMPGVKPHQFNFGPLLCQSFLCSGELRKFT